MKSTIKLAVTILSTALMFNCAEEQGTKEVVITEGLKYNESTLAYDGGLLIANFGGTELQSLNNDGHGYISMLRGDKVSTFIPAKGYLSAPKGMLVVDGYLLVCDVSRVVAFDLKDLEAAPQVLDLSEDEFFVNDLVSDGKDIYVSVTNSGNIFKIPVSALSSFAEAEATVWANVVGANGLVLSDDAIYVASYPANRVTVPENLIYKVSNLENPTVSKVTTQAGRWDGLAISDDKTTLYSTSWDPIQVVSIDIATGAIEPLDIETEFIGAADITLHEGKLYIPDLPNSQVIIKEL